MAETSPDIVHHTAAYKHVPLMQGNPHEAIRNNLGGTLAVLDAAVRFFMTIDEASQLIIQTTLLGQNGELFVLDMGEPVRILDLATSLVRATKPGLGITIVGLRPGEKMYEELSYDVDSVASTAHDSIFVTRDTP